jgi:hypothetical protein
MTHSQIFKDIENEVIKHLAERVARQADAEVLAKLYKDVGWHEVTISYWTDWDEPSDSERWQWCRDHLTGKYYSPGGHTWLFEFESDLILFLLRWQ